MIGIRFCGGCNPRYDRRQFFEKIKSHYEGKKKFEYAQEGKDYETLLVLGGCSNCCASYTQFTSLTEPLLIWDENHFADIINKIDNL